MKHETKAVWHGDLTAVQRHYTLTSMQQHGGAFVKAVGHAICAADPANQERLAAAFPDLIESYGPGSGPYKQITGEAP